MIVTLAILPLAIAVTLVLSGRNPIFASMLGAALAVTIAYFHPAFHIHSGHLSPLFLNSFVIAANVALVIAPGLLLNSLLQKRGALLSIQQWLTKAQFPRARLAVVLVVGLGPLLGSVTGFGVSTLLTVPILWALIPHKYAAARIAILGTNIVPWGTAALSTFIGAEIANVDFQHLATITSVTSSLVFPLVAVLTVLVLPKSIRDEPTHIAIAFALAVGASLSIGVHLVSSYLEPQIAGALGAAFATSVGLILTPPKAHPKPTLIQFAKFLYPYFLLVAVIAVARAPTPLGHALESFTLIQTDELSFRPFVNPGPYLIIVILILHLSYRTNPKLHVPSLPKPDFLKAAQSAVYPTLVAASFTLLAQTLHFADMIHALAGAAASLNPVTHTFIVPLVGLVGGVAAGSGVAAQSLLMNAQSQLGRSLDLTTLYAAAQTSSAGHGVIGSVSMAAITIAVIKQTGDKNPPPLKALLRFSMPVAVGCAGMVAISFGILLALV